MAFCGRTNATQIGQKEDRDNRRHGSGLSLGDGIVIYERGCQLWTDEELVGVLTSGTVPAERMCTRAIIKPGSNVKFVSDVRNGPNPATFFGSNHLQGVWTCISGGVKRNKKGTLGRAGVEFKLYQERSTFKDCAEYRRYTNTDCRGSCYSCRRIEDGEPVTKRVAWQAPTFKQVATKGGKLELGGGNGRVTTELAGSFDTVLLTPHGNSKRGDPFEPMLPEARRQRERLVKRGVKPRMVHSIMAKEGEGKSGTYPNTYERARDQRAKVPEETRKANDAEMDQIKAVIQEMIDEGQHENQIQYIQQFDFSQRTWVLHVYTEVSMRMLELLTCNDGPFYMSLAPASLDPANSDDADCNRMEFVVPNLFLQGNPRWIGAFVLYLRSSEFDFEKMLENLINPTREAATSPHPWPNLKYMAYIDTDHQVSLRNAIKTKFPLAQNGEDYNHHHFGLRDWMRHKAELAEADISRVLANLKEVYVITNVDEARKKLYQYLDLWPNKVQRHFERTKKAVHILTYLTAAGNYLSGRVFPSGEVDRGKNGTQGSEAVHQMTNRVKESMRAILAAKQQQEVVRQTQSLPCSPMHLLVAAMKEILWQQQQHFWEALTRDTTTHWNLKPEYAHLRHADADKQARNGSGTRNARNNAAQMIVPSLTQLYGPDGKLGSAKWNTLSRQGVENQVRNAPPPGTRDPVAEVNIPPEYKEEWRVWREEHYARYVNAMVPSTGGQRTSAGDLLRLAYMATAVGAVEVIPSLDGTKNIVLVSGRDRNSFHKLELPTDMKTHSERLKCPDAGCKKAQILCVHKLSAYIAVGLSSELVGTVMKLYTGFNSKDQGSMTARFQEMAKRKAKSAGVTVSQNRFGSKQKPEGPGHNARGQDRGNAAAAAPKPKKARRAGEPGHTSSAAKPATDKARADGMDTAASKAASTQASSAATSQMGVQTFLEKVFLAQKVLRADQCASAAERAFTAIQQLSVSCLTAGALRVLVKTPEWAASQWDAILKSQIEQIFADVNTHEEKKRNASSPTINTESMLASARRNEFKHYFDFAKGSTNCKSTSRNCPQTLITAGQPMLVRYMGEGRRRDDQSRYDKLFKYHLACIPRTVRQEDTFFSEAAFLDCQRLASGNEAKTAYINLKKTGT